MALWSDGERCHGVITDGGPVAARGDGPGDRRRRGALAAHHQPAGARSAPARCWPRPPAPTSPTSSSASSTRPRSPCPAPASTALLITEAVRGEGATLLDAAGRALHRRARPARRGHRGDPRPHGGRRRAPRSSSTCAALDPARFPNVFASLAEAGLDPPAEPVPVAPAAHYTMGGDRRRPRRPLLAARPLRGRRVLLHRPARRQPARLQLAQRVLRLRRPRRGRGARGEPARRAARAARSGASSRRPRRPATPSGASPARCATPTASRELLDDPYPLAAAIATCALERRESRGGHLRTDFPGIDPELDGVHLVARPTAEPRRGWP